MKESTRKTMKKLRHIGLMMTMAMVGVALLTVEVMAYSDAYFEVTGSGLGKVIFTASGSGVTGGTFTFSNNASQRVTLAYIPQQGGPVDTDPLVGKYVSIVGSAGAFEIGSKVIGSSNNWNLVPEKAAATISVSSGAGGSGTVYFSGDVKATTIDLDTGAILWDPGITAATFNALPDSEILSILRNSDNDTHYTLLNTFAYNLIDPIRTLLTSGAAGSTGTSTFSGNVTVVPEPGEWALLLAGLGVIGFSIYRKNARFDLTEASDFRMS